MTKSIYSHLIPILVFLMKKYITLEGMLVNFATWKSACIAL